MKNQETQENFAVLQFLPSVDALLHSKIAGFLQTKFGTTHLTNSARTVIKTMRQEILSGSFQNETADFSREKCFEEAQKRLENIWKSAQTSRLQPVINATGVIIHTNLGRAPLSENARQAMNEAATGYCNLEYDLETGKRGKRGKFAEQLLAEITGAESALIVNNCAAAAFLVLTVLAKGGEVIVSRGELVEIGGDFRVPDVMIESGASLREVGTTNRTKINDYENAINENTRLIAKIHPANYKIIGFTESVEIAKLADLAHRNNILLYEDAGSGAIFDLSAYGLNDEPIISKSIAAGADVITFSGDKLLGGGQSGLIVGRREIIEKIRKYPLYRALRVDKLICAALGATFESFQHERAFEEIPVLRMLAQPSEKIKLRTQNFAKNLREKLTVNSSLSFEIIAGNSVIGGGSAPDVKLPTAILAVRHSQMSAEKLEQNLRRSTPPVIARIMEDGVLIDLRTVADAEETTLLRILSEMPNG